MMIGGMATIQHTPDTAHQIVHKLGNELGYWWVLGLIVVGAYFVFRKRIGGWLK